MDKGRSFGNFELIELNTAEFRLDGGAMFGVVPKTLWQKKHLADELNRISLALRILLVRSKNFNLLIDTGIGNKWDEKTYQQLGITVQQPFAELLKQKAGLSPSDITHVLLTHLHFDHCGGLTRLDCNSNIQRVFENADILIHKQNFHTATHPNAREKASYLPENWQAYLDSGQVQFINSMPGEIFEVLKGVSVVRSDGHTLGQQCVLIDGDKNEKLFFCADLIPTTSHIKAAWGMGFDVNPILLMEEKNQVLNLAVKNNWQLFFEHDPHVSVAHVRKARDTFELG